MHLVFMTRGIQQERDKWKKFMETHMFWWKRQKLLKDKDGNFIKKADGTYERGAEELTKVQGALRPIELWSYVVPESEIIGVDKDKKFIERPMIQSLLAMFNMHKNHDMRPEIKNFSWILRKMMKLKPIPKMPDNIAKLPREAITEKFVPMEAFCVYPIGIKDDGKEDMIFPDGQGWYQEKL